ncbi:MAG: beta-ketoacyl-[acyl-carrier-protein] synthase family protein [Labilithrix sp.]|nr:beta-ketoacyl-[acyl-carrier-protein] synthase family protein [Labilithrix sp.]
MIVVTGLGAVTSLGATAGETWERIVRGDRGLSELSLFPADGYRVRLVGEATAFSRRRDAAEDVSRTSDLALAAAREALSSAGLGLGRGRIGLVVGGSTAGMLETESLLPVIFGPEGAVDSKARDEALSKMLSHPLSAPTDRLARELGPFDRVRSLSSACSSGASAIMVGATWLELGLCDVVLCGAADALCRVTVAGFNALGSLDPEGARPFDRRRRGLTLGEGAGFVVLERAAAATARGKDAVCTLLGWAARAEAHHITNPEATGQAPSRAMEAALARAGLGPEDVDYVNAHGTGTPLNDPMETRALARVFGAHLARVAVSSQKGQIGHTLAASGAIEAIVTALAIAKGVVPPTGGLEDPDPECALLHVRKAERRDVRAALSSSFGFGGMDTVLAFGRADVRASRPARAPRKVVITGAAAITPAGIFEGDAVAGVLGADDDGGQRLTVDVSDHLDAARARRLDRASRIAAVACERALGRVDAAGIIFGNAFGSVEGTSAFMRRLQQKGARFASPADFPSLVPSSPAGHVSIYLGLGGPTMAVADLGCSGECAVTQAYELVAAGDADRIAVVAVEEASPIVDEVFRVVFGPDSRDARADRPVRREGAGAVALAAEDVARAEGLSILARVEQIVAWTSDSRAHEELAPPAASHRAVVVVGGVSDAVDRFVARSAWARCERFSCAERSGSHEAAGGIAVAAAASMLVTGAADAALCVGVARGWGYAISLRKGT